MCKITVEENKKYNGCNKKELASVLRDNNISYDEISEYIGFDFNNLMKEVYALPKIIITKLSDYLLSMGIDTTGVFYYETPNEDGCTNKEDYQNIKKSSLIALSNIKYDFKNIWRMTTLGIFFSEKVNTRLQNILSGTIKWSTEEEYENILFFKTGKGKYYPSIAERYLINVDLFNNATNEQQEQFCKAAGIPSFILDKILYDDMPVNLSVCDLLLNFYNDIFATSYKLKDFCREKEIINDITDVNQKQVSNNKLKRKYNRKSSKKILHKYSCKNIPQEVINGFPNILDGTISINGLSKITGVPSSTVSRMVEKMKADKEHYISLVNDTPIQKATPSIISRAINKKAEYDSVVNSTDENKSEPISLVYFDDSLKNHYSGIDLSIFSKYSPEYLRSISEYLIKLADLKDAAENARNIAIKIDSER